MSMFSTPVGKQLKLRINRRRIKNLVLHYCLRGSNVKCVCCGSKYITFLPAGIEKRPNARCIKCGSLERHRTLWMFLQEHQKLSGGSLKLLHVAPEKIFYDHFVSLKNIDYYPIDLAPEGYNYGIKTIAMDVTQLNFPNEHFDVIICNHVLEHIREDQKAMQEMSRVLKKGGWAILNTPVDMDAEVTREDITLHDPQKQLELFGQPDHVRVYGRDFLARLSSAGFQTEVINYTSKFNDNERFKYGFKKREDVFYCRK
jgi:SAM-dependent methyltransferase